MKIATVFAFVLGLLIGGSSPAIYEFFKRDSYFGERMTSIWGANRYDGRVWLEEDVFTIWYFTESAREKRDKAGNLFLPSCSP